MAIVHVPILTLLEREADAGWRVPAQAGAPIFALRRPSADRRQVALGIVAAHPEAGVRETAELPLWTKEVDVLLLEAVAIAVTIYSRHINHRIPYADG
jgi:hypothetical protein